MRSLALGMIAVFAGAVHSVVVPVTLRPSPQVVVRPPDSPGDGAADPTLPDPGAVESEFADLYISIEEAARLFEEGASFIDARTDREIEESGARVLGAFHLTTRHFGTPAVAEVLQYLSKEGPTVVYCKGGLCDASENVVVRLQGLGYSGLYIMHDGFPAWQAAGHDVEEAP